MHDQEILRLLSSGERDESVQMALEITPEQFNNALDRIQARAAVETGDAGRLYEKALRVRAENRLSGLEIRFAALMDLLDLGVLVVNARTGEIKEANAPAADLFGYDLGELRGLSVEALVVEDFKAVHPALRTGFLLSKRKRTLGYHPPIFGVRKDGSEVEMAIALTATSSDDDVMVVCTDRSRWAAATEKQTAESERGPR